MNGPSQKLFLGIDVGGTNIKTGVVDDTGHVVSRAKLPTEASRGPEHGVAQMCAAAMQALDAAGVTKDAITAVGLATPGTMDIPAGMLLNPPNLPGWDNFPVRQKVEDALGLPTVLQNDANAAAYGEYWAGCARDARSLVFFTLGTGLGGGIIVHDMIIEGEHSHGSEIGHTILEFHNGRRCATGQYGTAEAYCSATALLNRFRESIQAGETSSVTARISEATPLSPLLIAEEAEKGDELSTRLILEMAHYLGGAVTTTCHVIDPAMVLLGGAMTFGRHETNIGRRFLQTVREEFQKRAFPVVAQNVVVDYATLGGDAGFIGAAGCARRAFSQSG